MASHKTWLPAILLLALVSCRSVAPGPEMSLEEARDVVLSMQSVPLEPPARKMDDILGVLDNRQDTDALIRRAEAAPPETSNARDLYQFYKASDWRIGPYRAFQSRVHHRLGNFFSGRVGHPGRESRLSQSAGLGPPEQRRLRRCDGHGHRKRHSGCRSGDARSPGAL